MGWPGNVKIFDTFRLLSWKISRPRVGSYQSALILTCFMAVGVSKTLWEIEQFARIVDEWEARH